MNSSWDRGLMTATLDEIEALAECDEHDYDEDHCARNADAFIRTLGEIRALPEGD